MSDEMKPVELADDELEGVAGGYNWTKMYKKDQTMSWYCTGCNQITTFVCTSPTTKKGNSMKGWTYETTWVCTVCGKGEPFVRHKGPFK